MLAVPPVQLKPKAITLRASAGTGVRKMPLAQAHPFEPMPVTHEETLEVSLLLSMHVCCTIGFLPFDTPLEEVWMRIEQ